MKWSDIGGLKEVKQRLQEAIEWPLKYPEVFKRIRLRTKRNPLYGPPGCGKTYLQRQLQLRGSKLIAIRGPELISKWVGRVKRDKENL